MRFGDPECQALMVRFQGDLLAILDACASGNLDKQKGQVTWSKEPSMCVVMATEGYPGSYPKNTVIKGLDKTSKVENLVVFHAGTALNEQLETVSVGGRVLGFTALGFDLADAQAKAYRGIDLIDWPEGFCRRDIGWRALNDKQKVA